MSVPVSEFDASGDWMFYASFVSSDKTIQAYQDGYVITVVK
jgi:hypothetical protein